LRFVSKLFAKHTGGLFFIKKKDIRLKYMYLLCKFNAVLKNVKTAFISERLGFRAQAYSLF
jgi:hypothetical protein